LRDFFKIITKTIEHVMNEPTQRGQLVIFDTRDRSAEKRVYGEAAKEEPTEEEIENENESAKCKVQSAKWEVESERATEEQSDKGTERERRETVRTYVSISQTPSPP
jgi:hypothetical protein